MPASPTSQELLSSSDHYWTMHICEDTDRAMVWRLARLYSGPVSPTILATFIYEQAPDFCILDAELLASFKSWLGPYPALLQDRPMRGYVRADGWVADAVGGWYSPQEWQTIQGWLKNEQPIRPPVLE